MFKNSNKFLKLVITVLVLSMLNGCSRPELSPISSDGTILAFGDSLTFGVGTTKINSYPSVLAQMTGLNVINAGVSGETTTDGLARLPELLDRTVPDLLILIEGGNDILRNQSKSTLKTNLQQMIELAQSRRIPVVLIAIPEKSLLSNAAPLYAELAEQYGLVYDDSLIGGLQRSPSLKSDIVHFNKEGYREMAESIYELLDDSGAI
jgi:lysophospholipase L1-like esterase